MGIRFGPIARITFGLTIAAVGASSYAIIQHYVYITSPCLDHATDCDVGSGVSSLSVWLYGIPTIVTACSEVFINITAYGIAYSRAPHNMKGFVMALSLFMQAITTAISLATASAIKDPNLIWVFAVPAILGFVSAPVFWFVFRDLDNEDFFVNIGDTLPLPSATIKDEESKPSSLDEKKIESGDSKEIKA